MPLLALNTVLPQSMRVKYQLAIGVLPIGLMFAAFLPLWQLGSWLESHLGIPMNSPIKEHPNGGTWIAIFLFAMVALMILGYAVGWVMNAAVSRYFLGWSTEKVGAVYLQSQVPAHWLKEGAAASQEPDKQSIAKWEAQRKVGALRFIAVRGVLAWGGPMLLAMHLVPTFMKGQSFSLESTLFNVGLWACAGASFGAAIWYSSEANYRKLKKRSEA
jgi:hypothetical protein